jgi:heptaprenylglyceryl phosphate synthase
MLRLLNDDFQVVDMETDLSIISGSSEEEEDDFSAVIRELKQTND